MGFDSRLGDSGSSTTSFARRTGSRNVARGLAIVDAHEARIAATHGSWLPRIARAP